MAVHGGGFVTRSMYAHRKLFGQLAKAIGSRSLVRDTEAMRRLADGPSEAGPVITRSTTRRKRTTMRKLIESTLVSLDGVIEEPERWANFDAESTAYSIEQLGNYDAFVMGRVTYEKFFANWGHTAGDPYIDRISAMPKYVASRSLTATAWNATLLGPDPSRAIARLKDQPGKDLIKYGTSRFDDTLVRDHLIDEFRFWIMPVVAGRPTAVRRRGHLRAPPPAHRREETGERVGDPHLCARLTSVRSSVNGRLGSAHPRDHRQS